MKKPIFSCANMKNGARHHCLFSPKRVKSNRILCLTDPNERGKHVCNSLYKIELWRNETLPHETVIYDSILKDKLFAQFIISNTHKIVGQLPLWLALSHAYSRQNPVQQEQLYPFSSVQHVS